MSTTPRLDSDVYGALEDLYLAGMPDYRDDLVRRIATTRQRPVWMFPERWLPVDITTERAPVARVPWRAVGLMAMLALILAASLAVYVGSQQQQAPLPAPFGLAENGVVAVVQDGDIVAVDQVTGEVTPLVTGPEDDSVPAFSPDGTKIAFQRTDGNKTQLMVADADGSNLRAAMPEPLTFLPWWSFSPDGQNLLVAGLIDSRMQIFAQPIDAGARTVFDVPLPADTDRVEAPSYRPPDGREILVMAAPNSTGARGVFAFDPATSELREIVAPPTDGTDLFGASWSTTGDQIIYGSYTPNASDPSPQGWVVAANGGEPHLINQASGRAPELPGAVSNDGSRMIVDPWDDDPVTGPAIVLMAGDGPRVEIQCGGPATPVCPDSWIWAPDDSSLIGHKEEAGAADSYLIADPATGAVTEATILGKGAPTWQRLADGAP